MVEAVLVVLTEVGVVLEIHHRPAQHKEQTVEVLLVVAQTTVLVAGVVQRLPEAMELVLLGALVEQVLHPRLQVLQ